MATPVPGNPKKDKQLRNLTKVLRAVDYRLLDNGDTKVLKDLRRALGHALVDTDFALFGKGQQSTGGVIGSLRSKSE